MEKLQRIPFFRLLLPLIAGIIIQYYFSIDQWSIVPLFLGLLLMLLSYLIPVQKQYSLRWLFGTGAFLFLFSTGVFSTTIRQHISAFNFPDIHQTYQGTVIDMPQDKPNSIAYKVELRNTNKKIVCYVSRNSETHEKLSPGDNFIFFSKIEPFKSLGNPDEFDYSQYMYNKGYAGYTYINPNRWEKNNNTSSGFLIKGIQYRQKILNYYKTLNLNTDEYAILSALTLGYKDALSDDLKQSFQATGTAHVLAVSGMHVGIIYAVILSILWFIPKSSRWFWLKPALSILLLWTYTFIIGFPPSAVRASMMLSAFCIAALIKKRTYSLNVLFAVAFLMLIWNPFQLFDLGFQLSFTAVLSMLVLLPLLNKQIKIKNKIIRYLFNLFLVSLAAQIGTFPLCLYYFGTFPSYFFITNILIIPLIALIIYTVPFIILASLIGGFIPTLSEYIIFIPIQCYKILIVVVTHVTHFFESLPFAQLHDLKISLNSIFLIWIGITGLILFIMKRKPKALIISLTCILMLMSISIYNRIQQRNSLIIYNRSHHTYIQYFLGYKKFDIENISENDLLCLNGINYMIITQDVWKEKSTTGKFDLDYLHLCGNNGVSLYSLNDKLNIKRVILDSSLSNRNLKRFVSECEKLRIPYYDVSENGALRIFFY